MPVLLDSRLLVWYKSGGEKPVCAAILAAVSHVQGTLGTQALGPLFQGCHQLDCGTFLSRVSPEFESVSHIAFDSDNL